MLLTIQEDFTKYVTEALQSYGFVFAIFTIGLVVGIAVKQWLIDINFKKSVKERIADKDQVILDLKQIVHERVIKIEVQEDKKFFKRIKDYFKRRTA